MAFRPQWYDQEGRGGWRPGGGGIAGWSGMRIILTATLAVFAAQILAGSLLERTPGGLDALGHLFALRAWTGSPLDPDFNFFFPIQIVSYQFFHDSTGLGHVGFNMLFVWWFGQELEAHLGKVGFLRLYFTGGVVGGACQWVQGLFTGSVVPTVGASGAVYTVMMLYALLWPRRTILLFPLFLPVPVILLMGIRVASDLMNVLSGAGGQVAYLVHLGGAAVGFVWFKQGDVLSRWRDRHRREKATRVARHEADDRREMDRILSKIQASGLSSLTPDERAFLDRRSKELRRQAR